MKTKTGFRVENLRPKNKNKNKMTTEYKDSRKYDFLAINTKFFYIFILVIAGCFLLPKTAFLSTVNPQNIIDLTNKQRRSIGLEALKSNDSLTKAANEKAKAIFKYQSFAHNLDSKKFSSWIKDVGYDYLYVGENLAINYDNSEDILKAWLNSPLHKKNLLNPIYQDIGVATVNGVFEDNDSMLVVQVFGTPMVSPQKLEDAPFASVEKIYPKIKTYEDENLLTHTLSHSFTQDTRMATEIVSQEKPILSFVNFLSMDKYLDSEGFMLITLLFKYIFLYFFLFAYLFYIVDIKRSHL